MGRFNSGSSTVKSEIKLNMGGTALHVVQFRDNTIRAWKNGLAIPVSQRSMSEALDDAIRLPIHFQPFSTTGRNAVKIENGFSKPPDQPVYKNFSTLKTLVRALKNSKRVTKEDGND